MALPATPQTGLLRTRIVVPAYNEASRFDVAALDEYLQHHAAVDFILVNDGSEDDTLARLNEQAQKWQTRVQVLDLQPNRGKSEAVRRGVLAALARGHRVRRILGRRLGYAIGGARSVHLSARP